jgi:hypothetical protein
MDLMSGGTQADLVWPRLVAFKLNSPSGFVPKTKNSNSYEFQNRQNYIPSNF